MTDASHQPGLQVQPEDPFAFAHEKAPSHTNARIAELEEAERANTMWLAIALEQQHKAESAQQDAESWRLAYLNLLDRVLSAPDAVGAIIGALGDIGKISNNDASFGATDDSGRREYLRAIRDVLLMISRQHAFPRVPIVRVILGDGTTIKVVVLGSDKEGWLLSAPGIQWFRSLTSYCYRIHPEDLARLKGVK